MIRLEEFFPDLPRPGWPGRRHAIALALLRVVGLLVFVLLVGAALMGALVMLAAEMDVLP